MKKLLIVFSLLVVGLGVIFFFGKDGREKIAKIGDIRPAILPASKKVTVDDDKLPFTLPEGFSIHIYADGLGTPRDLEISPGGTILVSIPKSGQVVALPDRDGDGRADETKVIMEDGNKPHGLVFFQEYLLVAEETRVSRYHWDEENLTATLDRKLFDLPDGGRHTSRTLAVREDGTLYVSIGSRCDVCFENHEWIGTVIVSDIEGADPRVYAKGLRNAVFIQLHPTDGTLWATEMGRDFLGDDLPPDEVNILEEGGDYGWPVCYGDRVYDTAFSQRSPAYCQDTIAPVYNLPAHVAPLGLTFIDSPQFPLDWQGDLLVALHGSWNSSVPVGYKVVRLDIEEGKVTDMVDFIDGFLDGDQAISRPVNLIFDSEGSLYLSDDKGGLIYKIKHAETLDQQ